MHVHDMYLYKIYGFDTDLSGASSYVDTYVYQYAIKLLPAMVDLVTTMFSKLIVSSLPTVIWN